MHSNNLQAGRHAQLTMSPTTGKKTRMELNLQISGQVSSASDTTVQRTLISKFTIVMCRLHAHHYSFDKIRFAINGTGFLNL